MKKPGGFSKIMRFQCPYCRNVVAVDNADLGLDVQCGHCSEVVTVPNSRISTGCLIADFIVQEELGRGGMGVVYLAHQISLDRLSALKVLADQYANDAEFVVGFIKEARAAAKLNHPHIVQAYAVGEDEGVFYFAMENVEGETMKEVQKREKIISIDKAVVVIQQIGEALDYAWKEAQLVHRDIKPDNIMMTKKGAAKLADLGLARVAGDIDDSESDEVMGTPQYISPEHLTGAPMDVRSDIYSLGATFYHMITGRFAFEGRSATEIAKKHLQEPLQPPIEVNPDIPQDVSDIIVKMMEKNPKNRYQEAEILVDDLRIARRGRGTITASDKVNNVSTVSKKKIKMSGTSTGISKGNNSTKMKTHNKHFANMNTTGTHAPITPGKLKKKDSGSKKNLAIFGAIAALAIAGAAGYYVTNQKQGVTDEATEPANVSILDEISIVMESQDISRESFVDKCNEFFDNTSEPTDPKEKEEFEKLHKLYSKVNSELKLEEQKKRLHKKHAEAVAKIERMNLEKINKDTRLSNSQKVKAEKEKLLEIFKKSKTTLKQKQFREIDEFKKSFDSKMESIFFKFISKTKEHKYAEALKDIIKIKKVYIEKSKVRGY